MANGSTTLGGGWDQVPAGVYCENALAILLRRGDREGQALIDELLRRGFQDRGPAYYPPGSHGAGSPPFYALGQPHDYAALDAGVWDLIGWDGTAHTSPGATLPDDLPGPPTPAPPPNPIDRLRKDIADVASAFDTLAQIFRDISIIGR